MPAPGAGRTARRFPRGQVGCAPAPAPAPAPPRSGPARAGFRRPATRLRPPAAWRRPARARRGRAAADRPSRCRPAPDSRPRRRRARWKRSTVGSMPSAAAAIPAAIRGRVSASGNRHERRSIRASARSHQPSSAAIREEGGSTRVKASAPTAAAAELDQRVEDRQAATAMPAAAARGQPAPQRDEITGGQARAAGGAAGATEQQPAPAGRLPQYDRAHEAAHAKAEQRAQQRLRGQAPGRALAGGRRRQAVGVRQRPLAGHDERLRIGRGRLPPGRRDVGLRHAKRQVVGLPERAQPRAQLLADVARVLGVADHPRGEEDDQLGAIVDVAGGAEQIADDWDLAEQRHAISAPVLAGPGSGRRAPRSDRSGR